jgi:hypothetical protein
MPANHLVWIRLRFRAWRSKLIDAKAPHCGGFLKTTLLDSNAVERYQASKKVPTCWPTCHFNLKFEDRKQTLKTLRIEHFLSYFIALDIVFKWKDSVILLFEAQHVKCPSQLKKVRTDSFKVRQDIRAPIVANSTKPPWMISASFRMSKESFFKKLEVAHVRRMQKQVSTVSSQIRQIWQQNLITICSISSKTSFSIVGTPIADKIVPCASKIRRCSAMERWSICSSHSAQDAISNMQIGSYALIWCHTPNAIEKLGQSMLAALCCLCFYCVPWVLPLQTPATARRPQPSDKNKTQDFSQNFKITLRIGMLNNMRSKSLFTQIHTVSTDRAGCGPEWLA